MARRNKLQQLHSERRNAKPGADIWKHSDDIPFIHKIWARAIIAHSKACLAGRSVHVMRAAE